MITATKDEYAAKCLYRLFAFYGEQRENALWNVIFNLGCLKRTVDPVFEKINSESQAIHDLSRDSSAPSIEERKMRVKNLIDSALALVSDAHKLSLLQVLDEFCVWSWLEGEPGKE